MKFLSGLIRTLVILTLLIATAYNFWQVQQLKAEIAQLKLQKKGAPPTQKATLARSLDLLRASKAHADRAQVLLKAKRLEEAAKETKLAADTAQKAYSGAQSSDPLGELQSTVQSLSKQVGTLWEHQKDERPNPPKKDTQR